MRATARRAWLLWEDFLFNEVPLQPLALGRILLGVTMFLTYALVSLDLGVIWGPGGMAAYVGDERWLVGLLPHRAVHAALLVACVFLTVGLLTRWSCALVLLGHLYFVHQTDLHGWGSVRISTVFLIYFLLSRCGTICSFDAYLARQAGRVRGPLAPAWPLRLVQFHLCVAYYGAAAPRYWNPSWWHGEKAFEAVIFSIWGRFPTVNWMPWRPVFEGLTYATWSLELAAPLLLWWRRTRTPTAVALVGLHLGMELLTDTAWWQWLCLAALLTFLPTSVSARALELIACPFLALEQRFARGTVTPKPSAP